MEAWFNRIWYERDRPPWWLLPFEAIFIALSSCRAFLYHRGIFRSQRFDVPVVVIGNISVGGTGKTPLVMALTRALLDAGRKPGIVSRGHGGEKLSEPLILHPEDTAERVGDEPLLLAETLGVPVCVFPQRARAVRHLLANRDIDVVICDDGLQHYALERDIEIAVVDAARGFGNGHRLPAGPLREPVRRFESVDLTIAQGSESDSLVGVDYHMRLQPTALVRLVDGHRVPLDGPVPEELQGHLVAVAGIGNPQRFFDTLAGLGLSVEARGFPDHHAYAREDFEFLHGRPLIMTAKDAVKCRGIADANWWYLEVEASFDTNPAIHLLERLGRLQTDRRSD